MARGRERGRGGRAGSDIELDLREPAAEKASGYHAVPASGRGKGVLVLDESGALTDFARDACDRLSRAGFAALAPDLPGGADPGPRIDAAVRQLLDDHATEGPRVGVLGFGEGAVRLLEQGDLSRRIGCVVDCGGLPAGAEGAPPVAGPSVPTLLLFGEGDERVDAARRLHGALAGSRLVLLPETGADFMNPVRADRYRAGPAASAWDAALAFLGASL